MKLIQDICKILVKLNDDQLLQWAFLYEKYHNAWVWISQSLYEKLPEQDQQRFIVWLFKRWAKIDLINEVERGLYNNKIALVKTESREVRDLLGRSYKLRDFNSQGYPFKLLGYDWFLGVHDIFYNQYELDECSLSPGDVIIDGGAFIGDTAVFFNHKLAGQCEIHCFELLDENLALLQYNIAENNIDPGSIHLNKLALTNKTGDTIYVKPGGTQGSTSIFGNYQLEGAVETIRLDDYVKITNLARVDFIKMDIEGSEIPALEGAIETIRHFKPKLALCLYHKWDDVITIPRFLQATGVPYRFRFKWVQLSDGWEAVLLATPCTAESVVSNTASVRQDAAVEDWMPQALSRLSAACIRQGRSPKLP